MTLLLAGGLPAHALMVSDRRLSANGVLLDDESNKAAVVACRDARFAVTFTGLAALGPSAGRPIPGPAPPGTFKTAQWVLGALSDVAPPDYALDGMLARFAEKATDHWATLTGPSRVKAVEFLFAGFRYGAGGGYSHLSATVTNFNDDGRDSHDTFRREMPEVWPGYLILGGLHSALPDSVTDELVQSLRTDGAPAVTAKMVHAIRTAAGSPSSRGRIGGQCTSIVLPADPSELADCEYHTEHATYSTHGPNQVDARGPEFGVLAVLEPEIGVLPDVDGMREPVAVPTVGRNKRCPCGSGQKYKHCHGR